MLIPLSRLHAHPDNANVLPPRLMRKLKEHIESSGRYPPLIVRPHPQIEGSFQILDGHHRATALRELGAHAARCEVWSDVDDAAACEALLTLNRLEGSDDPHRRAALIERLRELRLDRGGGDEKDAAKMLAARLPDTAERIEKLLSLRRPPPPPASAGELAASMLQPITFFLPAEQLTRLRAKLREHDADRNRALIAALRL